MWSLLDFFGEPHRLDILDVGAALNERPGYQSMVEAGCARIIGFEPNAAECERLNREYGQPHRFFPHFVGDGEAATFHETNWTLTGSLYAPNSALLEKFQNLAELVRPVATHSVTTQRIDDIAEITGVDFFKIDVQGAELAVFRNALRALSTTLVVQTEVEFVELYRGQPLFAEVDSFLRSQGFQFHAFNGICGRAFKPLVVNNNPNAAIRQALWSDALYVRDWMRLDELEPDRLCKYAILAHDILRSFDLAHLVLEALDRRRPGAFAKRYLARLTDAASKPSA
jgi:FkbM family methyltransferase